ncbi:hypothetical protein [Hyphomonas sp.]|uniref:hypothetical protein n=1 Tax=Hyphomonas sp. TaxID=87 RepID=UPI00391AC12C
MLNRWIAGACLSLSLIAGGLSAAPASAQDDPTQQAVESYVNISLPAIALMKPYIGKSASVRAKAFAKMGLTDTTCDAPTSQGIAAGEHFAEGAGNLCGAMIAWMQNEDIYTCSRVRFSGNDFARTEPVNATIAKLHASQDILSTRLQLETAAGCSAKTVTYWGPKLLGLLDQLSASVTNAGDLQAPASGAAVPTQTAFDYTVFLCHLAYNADEDSKSAVTDAADDACYAMDEIRTNQTLKACRTLDSAIAKAASIGASDPLASQAKGLSSKLAKRFGSLDCGTAIAIAKVNEDAANAKQQAAATPSPTPAPEFDPYAKRNAIVGEINGETQSVNNSYEAAGRWYDRGNDYEACGYYQKALSGLRRLEILYADLRRETGDSDYSAKSKEMNTQQNDLLEIQGETCRDADRRLY